MRFGCHYFYFYFSYVSCNMTSTCCQAWNEWRAPLLFKATFRCVCVPIWLCLSNTTTHSMGVAITRNRKLAKQKNKVRNLLLFYLNFYCQVSFPFRLPLLVVLCHCENGNWPIGGIFFCGGVGSGGLCGRLPMPLVFGLVAGRATIPAGGSGSCPTRRSQHWRTTTHRPRHTSQDWSPPRGCR